MRPSHRSSSVWQLRAGNALQTLVEHPSRVLDAGLVIPHDKERVASFDQFCGWVVRLAVMRSRTARPLLELGISFTSWLARSRAGSPLLLGVLLRAWAAERASSIQLGKLYDVANPPLTGATFTSSSKRAQDRCAQQRAEGCHDTGGFWTAGRCVPKSIRRHAQGQGFSTTPSPPPRPRRSTQSSKGDPRPRASQPTGEGDPELKKEDELFGPPSPARRTTQPQNWQRTLLALCRGG